MESDGYSKESALEDFVRDFRTTLAVMVALKKGGVQLTQVRPACIVVRSDKTGDHLMLTPRHMKTLAGMIGN